MGCHSATNTWLAPEPHGPTLSTHRQFVAVEVQLTQQGVHTGPLSGCIDNQCRTSRKGWPTTTTGSHPLNKHGPPMRLPRRRLFRTVTPYVGAGAGAVKYDISQIGAFVDFRTLQVFNDSFSSKGWAPTVHAVGGADIRLYQRLYLTTEARYTWSSAELGADFIDFEPVSLGGLRLSAGLQIVF